MFLDLFKTIIVTLLLLLMTISTFLIGFCIYSIYKSKHLFKRPSTFFILNILLVHLYQSIIVIPLYVAKKCKFHDSYTSRIVCDAFRFTYLISYYCSILSVLLIALDRFVATFFILNYKYLVTKKRVWVIIFFMWIYVTSLSSVPFTSAKMIQKSNVNSTMSHSTCTYKPTKEWSIFMLIANCMIPYITLLILYKYISGIVQKLEQREKERAESFVSANINEQVPLPEQSNQEKCSFAKLSVVIAIAYFIFWSPSVFYHILRSFCPEKCFPKDFDTSLLEEYLGFLTKYVAFLDTAAAPIIYYLWSKKFGHISKRNKKRKDHCQSSY